MAHWSLVPTQHVKGSPKSFPSHWTLRGRYGFFRLSPKARIWGPDMGLCSPRGSSRSSQVSAHSIPLGLHSQTRQEKNPARCRAGPGLGLCLSPPCSCVRSPDRCSCSVQWDCSPVSAPPQGLLDFGCLRVLRSPAQRMGYRGRVCQKRSEGPSIREAWHPQLPPCSGDSGGGGGGGGAESEGLLCEMRSWCPGKELSCLCSGTGTDGRRPEPWQS